MDEHLTQPDEVNRPLQDEEGSNPDNQSPPPKPGYTVHLPDEPESESGAAEEPAEKGSTEGQTKG